MSPNFYVCEVSSVETNTKWGSSRNTIASMIADSCGQTSMLTGMLKQQFERFRSSFPQTEDKNYSVWTYKMTHKLKESYPLSTKTQLERVQLQRGQRQLPFSFPPSCQQSSSAQPSWWRISSRPFPSFQPQASWWMPFWLQSWPFSQRAFWQMPFSWSILSWLRSLSS